MSEYRCRKCILKPKNSIVTLNEEGLCNHCVNHEIMLKRPTNEKSELFFNNLISKYRKKDGTYDCIVPYSGGKDSSYVLYMMRKVFGMNVLAIHFDNGFQSEHSRRNIRNAVDKLGVGLITIRYDYDFMKRVYTIFLKNAGEFCTPCNMAMGIPVVEAAWKYRIPLIVYGISSELDMTIPEMYASKYMNFTYFKNVVRNEIPKSRIYNYFLPTFSLRLKNKFILRKEIIKLPDFIEWDLHLIKNTLRREIGWSEPEDVAFHGDCVISPIKDYIVYRRWGFSDVTLKYAALVRNGLLSRDQAMTFAKENEVHEEPPQLKYFLKELNITKKDFEQYIMRNHTEISNKPKYFWSDLHRLHKM